MPVARRRATLGPLSGTVTRLAVHPSRPECTVVYLDGQKAGSFATEVVQAAGLHTGDVVSEEDLAALVDEDEPHRARSRALHLLSARDRSTAEMESRLRLSGFTQSTMAATITWLQGLGYLDDARFAERYVAEKARVGWGERRIRSELIRKGIDRATLDAALATDDEDEEAAFAQTENLMALVRRRFGRQWREDRASAERRLTGFLARRGYDWDVVASVMRQMEAEQASAPGDEPE